MTTSPLRIAAPALIGGLLVALSLPPWGWWPLAWIGIALLALTLDGRTERMRQRALAGAAFGLGQFVVGLWWMIEFQAIGGFLVMLLETAFIIVAVMAVPSRFALVATPAALVVGEALRDRIPFGGLPMAGVALGQVEGPLAHNARLGGALLVLATAALAGSALAAAVRGRPRLAAALAFAVIATTVLAWAAPDGGPPTQALDIAVVQGGGPRGFRAVDTNPRDVFDAHVAASERISADPPPDLVLWPEDVIDITEPITEAPEREALAELARRLDTPVVAGVVEDDAATRFRNAAVLWNEDGEIVDRYDKVHRVPFGEYVPGRALVAKLADLSAIPRDAVAGAGAGVLRAEHIGPLGVVISFEVYFADRARAAVNAGAELLLVPTNAASFKTSQVPTTEVAAAQLRAIETGRDLAQAAPTGYGALIDHHGNVLERSTLGRREVLRGTLHQRDARTIYTRIGDWPMILLAGVVLLTLVATNFERLPRRERAQRSKNAGGG